MIPQIQLFTAAHPWISQILILWPVLMLISLWIWAICKERTCEDEDEAPVRAAGLASERRKVN